MPTPGFVIDFTERYRRISEGVAILRLSSDDEIASEIPAEEKVIAELSLSEQRFEAFDLLCEFARRGREEKYPDIEHFRTAAMKVAGFDPQTL